MSPDLIPKIDAWWTEFRSRTDDLDQHFLQGKKWDLPGWIHDHLQVINPNLMWEFGPAVRGRGHRLVITPESRRYLRPLVQQILARAPQIDGWEFYAYRLPEKFERTESIIQARTGGNVSKTFFRAEVDGLNRIDLLFLSRDYAGEDDRQALNDVFVATESLLGEEVLDRWIGLIEVAHWDHTLDEPQGIRNLKSEVDRLIDQVRNTLPDRPYFRIEEDLSQWSLYKLKPEEAEDYPGQSDMYVGKSMISRMWVNAHCGESFDSVRFSEQGEVFCYIKLDGTQGLDGTEYVDKGGIEDHVDEAVRGAEVGRFVGGGTGLRYSYIDLALVDVDRGAEIVKRVLREGNIGKRTWLQFFDADREAEWIGIWDDTPPPPMPDWDK